MPLKKGYSRAAIGANVQAEREAGTPPKQAIAIALRTAREAAKKRGVRLKGLKRPEERER